MMHKLEKMTLRGGTQCRQGREPLLLLFTYDFLAVLLKGGSQHDLFAPRGNDCGEQCGSRLLEFQK